MIHYQSAFPWSLVFREARWLPPGEAGRPKIVPKFEKWAGKEIERGSAEGIAANLVYDPDGKSFPLRDIWSEKPVLLVHSSLTCPVSRDNYPHLDRLAEEFLGEVNVVILYTTMRICSIPPISRD